MVFSVEGYQGTIFQFLENEFIGVSKNKLSAEVKVLTTFSLTSYETVLKKVAIMKVKEIHVIKIQVKFM
jgi:hypothetical protein